MKNLTDTFINELYSLANRDLTPLAIDKVKECMIDYLGVTFAGTKMLEDKGKEILDFTDSSSSEVSAIGYDKKTSIYNAALLNGINAHIADLDDGVRQGSIHPGAPIFSALFPLAKLGKISATDFMRGIIVGYEAAVRLASAIQPSHRNRGYHATGTCGAIGVTMGIAAALQFSRQKMKNALSAVATSTSGLLNVIKGSSELKPYNSGQAAVSGLMASIIANAGFKGSQDILSGDWGFLNMISDKTNLQFFKPSKQLCIELVYIKPYAACRHCHPAIDAALLLRNKHNIDPEKIVQVKVQTYLLATKGHDHVDIEGITSAKMSTPFSVAIALNYGDADINRFTVETIKDIKNIELTKKVKVKINDNLNSLVPAKRPAIIEISTSDNLVFSERVDLAKGEPENPLSQKQLQNKFKSLMLYSDKTLEEANILYNHVWNLEKDFQELLKKI